MSGCLKLAWSYWSDIIGAPQGAGWLVGTRLVNRLWKGIWQRFGCLYSGCVLWRGRWLSFVSHYELVLAL
ncbi:hypothetical protein HBI80_190510 [Parastagonospora nodorum]|nr:hypothetical protein HBI80_190510 [Parastagonospora nodorum]KAH5250455.1 hypothetical protein HBI71_162450 [Parastagonospora nodorum]KAH5324187.1 hypothetical protein HBI12_087330 [Parastagonospora nodorum]